MAWTKVFRWALPLAGAGAGYAWYHYVGCVSGTCPLTSNGWIMTSYGALMGWLVVPRPGPRKEQQP